MKNASHRLRVSLKVAHPSVEPDAISTALALIPKWTRKVGDVRKTPTGHLLNGVNQETYWLHEFAISAQIASEDSLAAIVDILQGRGSRIRALAGC